MPNSWAASGNGQYSFFPLLDSRVLLCFSCFQFMYNEKRTSPKKTNSMKKPAWPPAREYDATPMIPLLSLDDLKRSWGIPQRRYKLRRFLRSVLHEVETCSKSTGPNRHIFHAIGLYLELVPRQRRITCPLTQRSFAGAKRRSRGYSTTQTPTNYQSVPVREQEDVVELQKRAHGIGGKILIDGLILN